MNGPMYVSIILRNQFDMKVKCPFHITKMPTKHMNELCLYIGEYQVLLSGIKLIYGVKYTMSYTDIENYICGENYLISSLY